MDYSLAFRSFFGIVPSRLKPKVIITNILPIYHGMVKASVVSSQFPVGFYEGYSLQFCDGQQFDIIKVLPGNSIIDVLKLLTKYCNEITFLGIAGCLDDVHSLGDICTVHAFMQASDIVSYDTSDTSINKSVLTICQTSGLIQDETFYRQLKVRGVNLVDMECNDVYSMCHENHVSLNYIVQVSDRPLDQPFYLIHSEEIKIGAFLKEMGVQVE